MAILQTGIAAASSVLLRLLSISFFEVIPGPKNISTVIFSLFAIYVPSFVWSYITNLRLEETQKKQKIRATIEKEQIEPRSKSESLPAHGDVAVVKKYEVEKTRVRKHSGPAFWQSLLLGIPNPSRPIATVVTLLINVGLVLLTADFVYRARWLHPCDELSFIRLGYVSHSDARFLVREPDQSKMPVQIETRSKNLDGSMEESPWQIKGVVRSTSNETDFTAGVTVHLTHSDQRMYEWRSSNHHSGEFASAPKPGFMPNLFDGKFTFLATSCILPGHPYNPFGHPLSIPGLKHIARWLPQLGAQFMLFMGDFIYFDLPVQFGTSIADYRMKYRQVYASPEWAGAAQNLSWIHVIDDHEILNDWSANSTGIYPTALSVFDSYLAQVNPPHARMAGSVLVRRPGATYYEFTQGPASFFLLDTRSYRSPNILPDSARKTMLGREQLADLMAWLGREEPIGVKWKVVVSSVPFTKNWPINGRDTWAGVLRERSKILEAMWDAGALGYGVVVLSGDRHEFAATKFPPPARGRWPISVTVYEFSASPLNQLASPIKTYKQTDDEDVEIKYIPAGRSKFGAVSMESIENGQRGLLTYTLYINGEPAWNTSIKSPPPPRKLDEKKSQSFWDMFGF